MIFSATRSWREVDISLDELRAIMPPGVVSPKARGVSVWPPIVGTLTRTVSYATRSGSQLLSAVTGGEDTYLTAIDLEHRLAKRTVSRLLNMFIEDEKRADRELDRLTRGRADGRSQKEGGLPFRL